MVWGVVDRDFDQNLVNVLVVVLGVVVQVLVVLNVVVFVVQARVVVVVTVVQVSLVVVEVVEVGRDVVVVVNMKCLSKKDRLHLLISCTATQVCP